jgi:hypothetical protein
LIISGVTSIGTIFSRIYIPPFVLNLVYEKNSLHITLLILYQIFEYKTTKIM